MVFASALLCLASENVRPADDVPLDLMQPVPRQARGALLIATQAGPELLERRPARVGLPWEFASIPQQQPLETAGTRTLVSELVRAVLGGIATRLARRPLPPEEL